jgi:hypothetical protein
MYLRTVSVSQTVNMDVRASRDSKLVKVLDAKQARIVGALAAIRIGHLANMS